MSANPPPRRWPQRRLPGFDYSDPDCAYFVTICAKPGPAPFTDERLAKVVLDSLNWLRKHRGVAIYTYCLMPDHLHLLLRLGRGGWTLGDIVRSFKRYTTRASWKLGYQGALWQHRFYDHILRKSEDGVEIATYIWPIQSGRAWWPRRRTIPGVGCWILWGEAEVPRRRGMLDHGEGGDRGAALRLG